VTLLSQAVERFPAIALSLGPDPSTQPEGA